MDFKKTLLFFGIPGLVIFSMFTWGFNSLIELNLPVHWVTFICLWIPLLILLSIVLMEFKKSDIDFKEFFWINKLNKRQLLIVLGAFLIAQVGELLLSFTTPLLATLQGFRVPDYFPDIFRADLTIEIPLETFLGMNLSGNYYSLFFFAIWLTVNIGCEEILWRGYALPRMEMYFHKWAWLVNGILWNISIHYFMRWSIITLLPVTLIVPYLSQRYKSIWPGVIIHGLGNLLIYVVLIPSVIR
ncbi:CAAX protease self-immunity [Anaerovirgula multivorans]|uniref:CAAX protease self-immunity n=1 Tax=Anaerovirgula multivorans TaxID=312168 RepID=A0A239DW87_9FIRM|nr:CPBP family intramembrane glutamic endopeptidase [Anaerovirgula multivorans]SNS36361.1 CAAX protease self-immunity [Anaerovirgula multivorans]